MKKNWLIYFLLVLALQAAGTAAGIDFAPLFSIDTDMSGNRRIRALGPVFEFNQAGEDEKTWAVRPFTSFESMGHDNKTELDILWPVWSSATFRNEHKWQLFFLINKLDYDVTDPASRYRFWMLPIYFQGRDAHGENYLAVFPFGGKLHEFIGRDKIWFVLFPLASYSIVNKVETRSYLWPIFSRTTGNGHDRLRLFPIYGYSSRRDDYTKKFVLWPIWTSTKYNYPYASGSAYVLFPLYGRVQMEGQNSWLFLPPFFRFAKSETAGMVYCPWPFFQRRWGEVDLFYLWPLFGYKNFEYIQRKFFLWPIISSIKKDYGDVEHYRFMALPIITSKSKTVKNRETGEKTVPERFLKIWPLMSYNRTPDATVVKALSLWPFKDFKAIERNYAPIWTLYSREKRGDMTEDELLWGLLRYRRSAEERNFSLFPFISISKNSISEKYEWSFLKGLAGYRRGPTGRKFRVLYLFSFGEE